MSAHLHQYLDRERLRDCIANDEAMRIQPRPSAIERAMKRVHARSLELLYPMPADHESRIRRDAALCELEAVLSILREESAS
jgi:hypothetical protein